MYKPLMKRILVLSALIFTFTAWGTLPPELELINNQAGKDLPKNCVPTLNHWLKMLDALTKRPQNRMSEPEVSLKESFLLRLKIHQQIGPMPVACKKLTQGVFAKIREYEDLLGSHIYPQKYFAEVDYSKISAPVLEHQGYAPYFLNPKFKSFTFEDGDIVITKGISTISSSVTTFTDYQSPFSHIAFVHVDPVTKKPETIESYIGRGVTFFTMIDAMKNENARVLILRPRDRVIAKKAADYMRERVRSVAKKGSFIPYDYQLDFEKNETLSCEEVAFDSFKTASSGKMIIPEAPSFINYKNTDLTSRVGTKYGKMMMPADMEVDSRFDIVLDWTDYHIIRDSWRKDVMMKAVLNAVEAKTFDIPDNYKTRLVPYIWGLRSTFLWPLASKISGIPVDYTPDVPAKSIATMVSFRQIEAEHLPTLQTFDTDYFKTHKTWPTKEILTNKMHESIYPHIKLTEK